VDVGYNSASVCAPRADRSLKIETGNLCGDSRRSVAKRNTTMSNQLASRAYWMLSSLEWSQSL